MGNTEFRRTMRVIFHAADLVRDARKGSAPDDDAVPRLDAATRALHEVQVCLVDDAIDRHHRHLRRLSDKLKSNARSLRPAHRDVADALADGADAVTAIVRISRLSVEAGLVD